MPAAPELLRPGLLDGVAVVLAGPPGGSAAPSVVCAGLGARVGECRPTDPALALDEAEMEAAVELALSAPGGADVLVVDAAGFFAAGGREGLVHSLQASWNVTRTLANRAFIGAGGGRIIILAPATGEHAAAATAALENLARTLSIEWARYGITAVTLAPGPDTTTGEVATLVAYLASSAGEYFSGCLLDLRSPLTCLSQSSPQTTPL
jgi:NAD(P)-dependent dehydrogenase (short-subunit alcohol dehydrogenase family)